MEDAFGRKITYLRVSLTQACNLRCQYCMPAGQNYKQYYKNLLRLEELYSIIKVFTDLGIQKVRITGGEPLIRPGIVSFIEKIAALQGIQDLAMTTNGILLKQYARDLKEAGLHRLNISIDSLHDEQYRVITGGGSLKTAMEGIEEAKRLGLRPIKVNTVLIKGFNDDEIENFVRWAVQEDIEVRFIELMPIGNGIGWAEERFLSADAVLEAVPELKPVSAVDSSSTAVYYHIPEKKGKVGLIRPISCKFCSSCNRVRLTANGTLKYCLHSNMDLHLKKALREGKDLAPLILHGAALKPEFHGIKEGAYMQSNMFQIGG